MDKLKLAATVVVLLGGALVFHWLRGRGDDETLRRVDAILEEMCACKDVGCANWVAEKFERELSGKKMRDNETGLGGAYEEARLKLDYMKQCYRYITEGTGFSVERDSDGKIRFVRPDSFKKRGPLDGVNLDSLVRPQ